MDIMPYQKVAGYDPNIPDENNMRSTVWLNYWNPCEELPFPEETLWPNHPNNP